MTSANTWFVESTLKRHGYYCRSRKSGITSIRVRSCVPCAKRKAKCDNKRPTCSRCTLRDIDCHFPTKAAEKSLPKVHQNNLPTDQRNVASSFAQDPPILELQGQEIGYVQVTPQDASVPYTNFADFGNAYQPWDFHLPELSFPDLLNAQTFDEFARDPTPNPPSSSRGNPNPNPTIHLLQTRQDMDPYHMPMPASPSSSIRVLTIRPRLKPSTQRIANLLFHNLKCFPLMMSRHGSLPPFIHPYMISSEAENSLCEPLTNCISLVHMISSRIHGSRKLFWKNVRLECERLCADVCYSTSNAD